MHRAPRHCVLVTSAARAATATAAVARRAYTPIFVPELVTDNLAAIRHEDELHTLWASDVPVPTLGRAVQLWVRYGNDPVVHTSIAPRMPDGTRSVSDAFPSPSPFAYAEDYFGTNLVEASEQRLQDSAAMWTSFFERKFLMRLRQSRRTSANHIGLVSAPDAAWKDEADDPSTRWAQDTHFRELAFLSERHLKEKVGNPLQLEEALVRKASPEQFIAFFLAHQQETASRVPLPVPAVWVYDGEAQKAWVERYHPAAKAAFVFFRDVLDADVKKSSSVVVTTAVAQAMKKVHAVLLQRIARQVKAGVCPDWTKSTAPQAQLSRAKKEWTQNACEKNQRRILEGDVDPEDLLDTSGEWKEEHGAIEVILSEKVDGCSFTLKEFWTHTLRREELETSHILESERLRDVAAAAQRVLLDELHGDYGAVFAGVEQAIAQGQLDIRAATFQPKFNAVYAKLNYAKFGGSSIVQHTNTASRELMFHYAASVEEVTAAATLYYATKPMSSKLNYASPYTLRRSLASLCAAYGVERMHATQKPFLQSAANLAKAEDIISRVVQQEAIPLGVARRAAVAKLRADNQRLLSPVSKAAVHDRVSELLATGAEFPSSSAGAVLDPVGAVSPSPVTAWPLGAVKVVKYSWPTPHKEKLKFATQAGSVMTADRMVELQALQQKGRLELSLWRRRRAAEVEKAKVDAAKEAAEVAQLVKQSPELAEVKAHAGRLYSRLSRQLQPTTTQSKETAAEEEWVFAVMLDDNAPLTEEEAAAVYLPYTDAQGNALPDGEYRVRVRAYDMDSTVAATGAVHPAMCSEAFSSSFTVTDALPKLLGDFFGKQKGAATVDNASAAFEGKLLIPLCESLRAAGLDVPLRCEFEAGQGLDLTGSILFARFTSLVKSSKFHRSKAEAGVSDAQREVEADCRAHWGLYHPGASAEEWAVARRDELNRAMRHERAWWLPDRLLAVGDVVNGAASDSGVHPTSFPSTARYGAELCAVLSASGSSLEEEVSPVGPGAVDSRLRAECTVDGTGAFTALRFSGSAAKVSVEDALAVALDATRRAQDRHGTLSLFKLAPFEKAAQVMGFCGAHSQEFGGKYARTYGYAVSKAKAEMASTMLTGRQVPGLQDSEKARLSEAEEVDRFASSTHPELRKKQFAGRVTTAGQTLEDPTPDQTSTWGR